MVTAVADAAKACYIGISGAVFDGLKQVRCRSCRLETRLHFVLAARAASLRPRAL